jgi:hypothetical protein
VRAINRSPRDTDDLEKRVFGIKNIGDRDKKFDTIVDVLHEMRGQLD